MSNKKTFLKVASANLKKYEFLRSLWFFENENFSARAAEIADFLELNS